MKLVLFAAVVAIAAASVIQPARPNHRWVEENAPEYSIESNKFEAGKEYQYMYNGQLMTGIPQSSEQHSATRIQSVVSIIFREHDKLSMQASLPGVSLILQLRHVRFASLNDKVSEPRRLQPFGLFEPIDIVSEHLETLRLPVECKYHHGMIKDLVFDGADAPWSVNIKRGVLNMIQVNLRKERRTDLTEEMEKETIQPLDMFTTQEETIEGDCETVYTVESVPEQYRREVNDMNVLNVTKSIDFEKCQVRPRINYDWRVADVCPTCEERYNKEDKTVRASTIIRQAMLVTDKRDNCLIEKVVVESHYTIVPFNNEGNVIQTYVNMTLELIKSSDRVNSIPKIENPIKSDSRLMTTLDLDVLKEEFNMNGKTDFMEQLPYGFSDNKELVRHCLERMVHETRDVNKDAPRYFSRLVTTLRMLTKEEIEQVHEKFMKNTPFNSKDTSIVRPLLVDAMAIAGTQPTMEHVIEKIANRQVSPVRAAFLIRKMSSPRVVSREMIDTLEQLTTVETSEQSRAIWQSAQLAYGSLINVMCKDSGMDRTALMFKRQVSPGHSINVCDREMKREFADKLFARFEECESTFCKVVVLKSIANAALDISIERLSKMIVSTEYSPLVRVEAVLATRNLVDIMPRKVQQILLPVYLARRQTPPQVRIAAIHQLLKTQPEKSLLDQLTRSLLVEENKQVAAYTFTYMNSLANSTNPCEKKFAQDLTLSLRHARFVESNTWMSYSKNLRAQFFSTKLNSGASIDWNTMMTNMSMIPSDLSTSIDLTAGNQWMRNLLTIGASQENLEQFVQQLARRYSSIYRSMSVEKSSEEKYETELESFFEKLDIVDREEKNEYEPYMQFYIRAMNQDYGVLPIDSTLLPEWIKEISAKKMNLAEVIRKAERMLKDQTFNLNVYSGSILHEDKTKISTVIGLPLVYSRKTPITAQLTGRVSFNMHKSSGKFSVKLENVRPRVTLAKVYRVDAWSPIVNSGVKTVANVVLNTPVDAEITLNTVKPEIKIAYKPLDKEIDILRIQSRPVTTVLVWGVGRDSWKEAQEMTVQGEWNRETTLNKSFGKRSLGLEFGVRGHYMTVPTKKVSTTPYFMVAGVNKIVVSMRPGLMMPESYEMIIGGKLFERLSKQKMGKKMNNFFTESDEYLQSSEEKSAEYSQQYEGSNPTRHQLRVLLKTVGSSIKREAVVESSLKCGDLKKACTYKLAIRRTPVPESQETEEWKLDSELSVLYPEMPKNFEEIATGKYMCRLNAKWGNDKFVDIKLVGEQSELMEKLIERSVYRRSSLKHKQTFRSLYSPVSQHEQLVKFSVLDQYKIDADYSVSPIVRNMTEKALRLAKTIYYWQTEVNSQLPKEMRSKNQIRARFNIDPINRQYVNVTIETPVERVVFRDIALPMPIKGVNIRSGKSFRAIVQGRQVSGVCQLRSGRVQTFDGVKYSSPIPQCWTLLTKDCHHREQSKFAVFVKETESELKSIKIVTKNVKLVVRAVSENVLECELNGKTLDCSQIEEVFVHGRHLALRVTPGEYLKMELPEAGIRVYFDGLSVNVKTSNSLYSSSLCGLCGQFDREERCELMTAQRECLSLNLPKDIRRFVQSYMIEECDISEVEEHYTHEPLIWEQEETHRQIYGSEEETPITYGYNKMNKKTITPRPVTRVIEQRGQVCFSKQPVRRCPTNTRPLSHELTKTKVVYACLERVDMDVERLHREANRHVVVEGVAELDASFTHELYEPVKCIRV